MYACAELFCVLTNVSKKFVFRRFPLRGEPRSSPPCVRPWKTIAVFITHVQYFVETCSATYLVGNFSSNISLTFPKTSGKGSLHLIGTSDYP